MFIVQRCWNQSRAGLAAVLLVGAAALAAMLPAADTTPGDLGPLVQEQDSPDQFVLLAGNRLNVVWSELSRSKLFKQFGADPKMAATATKLLALLNGRLQKVEELQPGMAAGSFLTQCGTMGPFTAGFYFDIAAQNEYSRTRFAHASDQKFLRLLFGLLTDDDARFVEQLVMNPNPELHVHDTAYRVRDGWTILQGEWGARTLINDRRILLAGSGVSEDALMKPGAVMRDNRKDFVQYVSASGPWLGAILVDFTRIGEMADRNADQYGPKNPELFGGKMLQTLRAREIVNADGRFEATGECGAENLHMNLFFKGLNDPMSGNLSKAVPDDAALVTYANMDFGAICAAGPDQFKGHNAAYADFIQEVARDMKYLADGDSRWSPLPADKKVAGPEFDVGVLWVLYDPDRLEDFEHAYTVAFGVKPGFKPTEAWARNVLHHPTQEDDGGDMEGQGAEFKAVDYGGVTIYLSKRWRTQCVAVTNSALIIGEDLKFMKKMIRSLQNVEAQQIDKNNFAEWPKLQAMAQKEGGNFCAFGLARTDRLLAKYGRVAIGGLALVVPGIETDMDWTKMCEGLEPSMGVVTYTAGKGLKARTVAELPLGTFAAGAAIFALTGQSMYEGRWWGRQDGAVDENDLPPLAGHEGIDYGNGPMKKAETAPAVVEPAPAEEAVPEVEKEEAPADK